MSCVCRLLLLILLCSCSSTDTSPSPFASLKQTIKGRDHAGVRFPVYQVEVPLGWVRRDSFPEETLADTTKPICEFFISDEAGVVRIAFHNFPTDAIAQRIPHEAQVARWQRQIAHLHPSESYTVPQAFGGFSGLLFKGVGKINGEDSIMLAWSLHLADTHYRNLLHPPEGFDQALAKEMRADVTIKAVGPKSLVEAKEQDILEFVRSFELIEEVPSRP